MSVSLLLVVRFGATALVGLLEHLAALPSDLDFELVIAAHGPDGAVRTVLDTLEGDVTIVEVADDASTASALEVARGAARWRRHVVLTPSLRPTSSELERLASGGRARVRRVATGPLASVIICTRDRPQEVRGCVEGLLAAGLGASGCQVVIVDNGATDDAVETIAALAASAPGTVAAVREPIAGLSRARMTGAMAAVHDVLIYLDDDARADDGWLEALRDAFDDPAVAIAGGPIRAVWDAPTEGERVPPAWGFLLGVLDLGDADRTITPDQGPYGGNWAVRRPVLEAVGGFDQAFGPSDASRLGGEESHVSQEVSRRHLGLIRYVAAASVGHRTSASVTDAQLALRAFRVGAGEIAVGARGGTIDAAAARRRMRTAAQGVAAVLDPLPTSIAACLAALADSEAALADRLLAAARAGHVAGCAQVAATWTVTLGARSLAIEPENARGIVEQTGEAVSSW